MFAALRVLNTSPPNGLSILDIEGNVVHKFKSQIYMLTFHFKCPFAPDGVYRQLDSTPQHLAASNFNAMEVQTAAAKLMNRRTCGPEGACV